jgi:uncharacterized protein (DUF1778 family)
MTTTKTDRIEMRTDPETRSRLVEAARLLGVSVSSFVLHAAAQEADRLLARTDIVWMEDAQFQLILESLHTPDPAPALERIASAPRPYSHA